MNGSEVVLWIPMLRNDLDNSFKCIKRLFNWLSCIQWHFLSGMDTLAGEAVLFKCFASLLRDIVSLRRSKLIGRSFQSRLPFIKWFGVQKSKQAVSEVVAPVKNGRKCSWESILHKQQSKQYFKQYYKQYWFLLLFDMVCVCWLPKRRTQSSSLIIIITVVLQQSIITWCINIKLANQIKGFCN